MNVAFSPNLGDGLLAECLVSTLIEQGAAAGTASVDLAAREAYGDTMAGRGLALSVLRRMPTGLRELVVRAPIAVAARRKWQPHYEAALDGADVVAIGGGNLLTDFDLNFPTKLSLALEEARARDLPVAIYACGMGSRWTREGDRRLRRALSAGPPRAVFLRDAASKERWDARFGEVTGVDAEVVRDPGLLASEVYRGVTPGMRTETPVIGLGLMSHNAVCYHGSTTIGPKAFGDWYVDLARALRSQGARVVAFNNGAREDRVATEAIAPTLAVLGVEIAQPETPSELVETIAGCDAIAAFRMHAVIAAYSFGVPALAFKWDEKLDAFMASVDRGHWLADIAELPADAAAARLLQAADTGLDETRRAEVVGEARADVGRLLAAIG